MLEGRWMYEPEESVFLRRHNLYNFDGSRGITGGRDGVVGGLRVYNDIVIITKYTLSFGSVLIARQSREFVRYHTPL